MAAAFAAMAVPEIRGNTIESNTITSATGEGGGMFSSNNYKVGEDDYAYGDGSYPPLITGNKFINNDGKDHGGAIALENSEICPLIANNLFVGNHVAGTGGGAINALGATPYIVNNTFVGNRAYMRNGYGSGGAILLKPASYQKIFNNIFRDNYAEIHGQSIYDEATGTNPQYIRFCDAWNNEGPNSDLAHYARADGNVISGLDTASCLHADPKFVTFDPYYHLALDSPCIDKGINRDGYYLGYLYDKVPITDFDGYGRPVDILGITNYGDEAYCDLGAYEVQEP